MSQRQNIQMMDMFQRLNRLKQAQQGQFQGGGQVSPVPMPAPQRAPNPGNGGNPWAGQSGNMSPGYNPGSGSPPPKPNWKAPSPNSNWGGVSRKSLLNELLKNPGGGGLAPSPNGIKPPPGGGWIPATGQGDRVPLSGDTNPTANQMINRLHIHFTNQSFLHAVNHCKLGITLFRYC